MGQTVYTTYCMACHQANGQGLPPTFPALAGSKVANGPIEGQLDVVLHGRKGTAMAAFGTQLSPVDIAAVITYERNSVGDVLNCTVLASPGPCENSELHAADAAQPGK
jgi:cytochrome c oxidase subunit 2